jgi:hypothetical protein
MVREVYAAQLEDLASHGYIVAAISHTYDAMVTVFPGGRHINYDEKHGTRDLPRRPATQRHFAYGFQRFAGSRCS